MTAIESSPTALHCSTCDSRDRLAMRDNDRITLSYRRADGIVLNWPGTLKIEPDRARIGNHNLSWIRYDVWFTDESGSRWHGVSIGDSQLLHCRKLKSKARA